MFDFLDKTGIKFLLEFVKSKLSGKSDSGHTHSKADITDFPASLPANGGNADTVDGLHANGFIKVNSYDGYDCNTLYDAGLYLCGGTATNTPNDLKYGSLFVMPYRKPYGNLGPDYCAQIFIPNGDVADKSMWYRTSLQNTWNEWKRSCDDGNADTVDGLHASDLMHYRGQVTDPDVCEAIGIYQWFYPTTITNNPIAYGTLIVSNANGYKIQILIDTTTNKMYIRTQSYENGWTEWKEILSTSGGTMTGALVAQSNTNYTTPQVRNVTMSTSAPSGGSNGQIHYQYS